jgi:predicted RNase H-like nuclease (RuvC/YqgF family)
MNAEESTNTLKFAQRAKRVVTRAQTGQIVDDKALIKRYRAEIELLTARLTKLQDAEEQVYEKEVEITKLRNQIDEMNKSIITAADPAIISTKESNRKSMVLDGGKVNSMMVSTPFGGVVLFLPPFYLFIASVILSFLFFSCS